MSKNTSFEIAAFDSSLETYLIRPILGEKKNNNDIIEVEVFIKNNKNILKEFYNKLNHVRIIYRNNSSPYQWYDV